MEHAQEPWKVGVMGRIEGKRSVLADVLGYKGKEGLANARRIVACVNALAGVPTELIESEDSAPQFIKQQALSMATLVEQNKALLEALQRYVDSDGYEDEIKEQGRAAIAKAEEMSRE